MSLDKPPNGHPGTAFVTEVKKPDEKERENTEVERDAFFTTFGSVLVYGSKPMLEAILTDHKKKLSTYNAKLTRNKIPIRIRLTHSTVVKGRRYVYCGRYVYGKDDTFHGKVDNIVLRRDHIKEKWNKLGPPPKNPLEGFKYQVVVANENETDDIIVPYNLFMDQRFHHLLKPYTHFRLG